MKNPSNEASQSFSATQTISKLHWGNEALFTFESYVTNHHDEVEILKTLTRDRFRMYPQLFIYSQPGTGSSHLLKSAQEYLLRKYESLEVLCLKGADVNALFNENNSNEQQDAIVLDLSKRDFLFLDNMQEWMRDARVATSMALVFEARAKNQLPVIASVTLFENFFWPPQLPVHDNAFYLESKMPNRQSLFQIVKLVVSTHSEAEPLLPEYAMFHAVSQSHKSVTELLDFTFQLCENAKTRAKLLSGNSTLMEQFVNDQYKKFKKHSI